MAENDLSHKDIKNKVSNDKNEDISEKPIKNSIQQIKVYPFELPKIEGVDIESKKNKLKIEIDMSKFNLDDSKNIEKYIQEIISNTL
mgnify:FL=1